MESLEVLDIRVALHIFCEAETIVFVLLCCIISISFISLHSVIIGMLLLWHFAQLTDHSLLLLDLCLHWVVLL